MKSSFDLSGLIPPYEPVCTDGRTVYVDGVVLRRLCYACGKWKARHEFLGRARFAGQKSYACIACETPSEKLCRACGTIKPAAEFRPRRRGNRLRSWCKPCERLKNLFVKYGVTPAQYHDLLAAQNGGCAICGVSLSAKNLKQVHVDHDHSTGLVRGLLCYNCNYALGLLRDDPELLTKAAEYLRRHGK